MGFILSREKMSYRDEVKDYLRHWRVVVDDLCNLPCQRRERIFCLNAGNCGSKYLVELLRVNGLTRIFHEKPPDLDYIGLDWYLRRRRASTIKLLLRLSRSSVLFESSNRLFSVTGLLRDVFPESRFIHLHREGKDAIRSSVNKNIWPTVYSCDPRPRYQSILTGPMDATPFEKSCHYWANVNTRILDDLADSDHLSLSFGDLTTGRVGTLESFLKRQLKIQKIDAVNTKDNLKSKTSQHVGIYEEWPAEYREAFERIAQPVNERLGYGQPHLSPSQVSSGENA